MWQLVLRQPRECYRILEKIALIDKGFDFILTENGLIKVSSRGFAEIFGIKEDEVSTFFLDYLSDPGMNGATIREIARRIKNHDDSSLEFHWRLPDNTVKHIAAYPKNVYCHGSYFRLVLLKVVKVYQPRYTHESHLQAGQFQKLRDPVQVSRKEDHPQP